MRFLVDDLLPTGLLLVSGLPKIGKSYFVHQLSLAVATGDTFLGRNVLPGSVLFYAIEDGARRLKTRLHQQAGDVNGIERILYQLEAPTDYANLEEDIRMYQSLNPDLQLVVIDTLGRSASGPKAGHDQYSYWTDSLSRPQKLAEELGITIAFTHHLNKRQYTEGADDAFSRIYGNTALFGTVDTALILERHRGTDNAVLRVTGRDVEEQNLKMTLDRTTMTWHDTGPIPQQLINPTKAQTQFIELLNGGPMKLSQIARELGMSESNAHQHLNKAIKDGVVEKHDRGLYGLSTDLQGVDDHEADTTAGEDTEIDEITVEFDFTV